MRPRAFNHSVTDVPPKLADTPLIDYAMRKREIPPLAHRDDPKPSFIAADKLLELNTVEKQIAFMVVELKKHDWHRGRERIEGWTWMELADEIDKVKRVEYYYMFQRRASIAKRRGKIHVEMERKCNYTGNPVQAWRAGL